MELEQLKTIWKEEVAPAPEGRLEELLRQRSRSPIAKMKRNLRFEVVLVLVTYAWAVWYYLQNFKGGMLAIAVLLFACWIFFMWYYIRKMQLLRQMECVTCEIKSNLQHQLTQLQSYIRFYVKAGTWLFPTVMVLTGLIIAFSNPVGAASTMFDSTSDFLLFLGILVGIALLLTVPVYFVNKWYVRWLYGQHVDKLQNIVNEIYETEAPASNL